MIPKGRRLLQKNPVVLKFAKDAVRRVGNLTYDEAEDYLVRMQEAANSATSARAARKASASSSTRSATSQGLGAYDLKRG